MALIIQSVHALLLCSADAGANNYLGLSNHPEVVAAAREALDTHGFGLSSVRFICGTQVSCCSTSCLPRQAAHHVVTRAIVSSAYQPVARLLPVGTCLLGGKQTRSCCCWVGMGASTQSVPLSPATAAS